MCILDINSCQFLFVITCNLCTLLIFTNDANTGCHCHRWHYCFWLYTCLLCKGRACVTPPMPPSLEPVFKNARLSIYQHVCTYKEMRYVTIILPYCQPGTNPFFTYPVAVSCECNLCNTDYTDCTVKSIGPEFCSHSILSKFQLLN
ncbi:hypothetical protein FKM82_013336 [Ascaphus truei]